MKVLGQVFSIFLVTFMLGAVSVAGSPGSHRVGIGPNISISGGGLMLIGSVSTSSAGDEKGHPLRVVGWVLVVVGSLIDSGDLIWGAEPGQSYSTSDVWNSMVREAKFLTVAKGQHQDDLAIVDAAVGFGLSVEQLAQMTVEADSQV